MKKSLLFLVFCLVIQIIPTNILAITGVQGVVINEVMSDNNSAFIDVYGKYSDWIEFYNNNDEPFDLSGCYLSDSAKDLTKWMFPEGTVISPKGFLFVRASGNDSTPDEYHCNFALSKNGETLYFVNTDGVTIIDEVNVVPLETDTSYGRITDGAGQFTVFSVSTVSASNSKGVIKIAEPVFSVSAGLYTQGFDLELFSPSGGQIYYTLDGSEPNKSSLLYNGAIHVASKEGRPNKISMIPTNNLTGTRQWLAPKNEVFKGTVVRAVVFQNELQSKIATATYLVDKDIQTRYNLPIVSIVTDEKNLFDDEIGIYVEGKNGIVGPPQEAGTLSYSNYKNTGADWERPGHFELIDESGKVAVSQTVGLRIHGAYSRQFPQKSLRIYARDEKGGGNIEYEFFKDRSVKKFDNIILRNAGNDFGSSMFIDAAYQNLWKWTSMPIQDYLPTVVFINGEFWGIQNIRERYSKHYFAEHFGGKKDNYIFLDGISLEISEGLESDKKDFMDLCNFAKNNDLTIKENYEYIKTKVDVENVADYYIAQTYAANNDWPQNNIGVFRYRTEYDPEAPYGADGLWRYFLRDIDQARAYNKASTDNLTSIILKGQSGNNPHLVLFNSLLRSTEFKNIFLSRFCDHLNTTFNKERVVNEYKKIIEIYREAIDEHIDRWNYPASFDDWYRAASAGFAFANQRPQAMIKIVSSNLGISSQMSNLKIITDSSMGYVKVNSFVINEDTPGVNNLDEWTGAYFSNVPVTVTAVPKEGYRFVGWKGIVNFSAPTAQFLLSNRIETLVAEFEPIS